MLYRRQEISHIKPITPDPSEFISHTHCFLLEPNSLCLLSVTSILKTIHLVCFICVLPIAQRCEFTDNLTYLTYIVISVTVWFARETNFSNSLSILFIFVISWFICCKQSYMHPFQLYFLPLFRRKLFLVGCYERSAEHNRQNLRNLCQRQLPARFPNGERSILDCR
jgi:hypothetical protein